MRALRDLTDNIQAQRGHLFGWVPVVLGVGICGYFALPYEPAAAICAALLGLGAVMALLSRWVPEGVRPVWLALALLAGGTGLAGVRANMVAEPVLGFRYYGPVEGRIVAIDRSQSDAVRLTLDRVVLSRMTPARTPARVRVSLHGEQRYVQPEPGQVVVMTGHLSPPSGPVEPGGFDFQRMAWFQGLGAVGYTRTPVLLAARAEDGRAGLAIYRIRLAISRVVQDVLPGEVGAFAAAITTGDRSAMGQDSLSALRASNLAHLLAISGMHMGILVGFIFAVVRYGLALIPYAALRWPIKKVAALVALLAGAAYLALSGGNVATERAYIMVSVMLVAVLLDRRALTLRAVAIAALIVMTLRPEVVSGPGFQMSFAATTALVAVFDAMRNVKLPKVPYWAKAVGSVFLSSLVAGLATAPIAAFYFNQVSQFGLIANLLSVPLMGVLVMPAAVLAAVLAPFGFAWIGLWFMGLGLRWILFVAHFVADMDGALRHVVTPGPEVLALICLGGLFVILWRGRPRVIGLVPLIAGFALWQVADRPAVLIADSGSLIGVMTPAGRAVSKERGEGFAATSWLENDGAPVEQWVAYGRDGLVEDGRTVRTQVAGTRILAVRGSTALAGIQGCGGADLLITNQEYPPLADCDVFDIRRLRETGAVAVWVKDGKLRLVTVRDHTGERLWNTQRVRRSADGMATLLARNSL
ncbi:MAG: competence protein ComEC family protein [Octadecabacter sp.]|nr:competence protein ComEC family protein [Octadecabacter sp.]